MKKSYVELIEDKIQECLEEEEFYFRVRMTLQDILDQAKTPEFEIGTTRFSE